MKAIYLGIVMSVLASGASAREVEWCTVTGSGAVMTCFPSMASCKRIDDENSNVTCVAIPK